MSTRLLKRALPSTIGRLVKASAPRLKLLPAAASVAAASSRARLASASCGRSAASCGRGGRSASCTASGLPVRAFSSWQRVSPEEMGQGSSLEQTVMEKEMMKFEAEEAASGGRQRRQRRAGSGGGAPKAQATELREPEKPQKTDITSIEAFVRQVDDAARQERLERRLQAKEQLKSGNSRYGMSPELKETAEEIRSQELTGAQNWWEDKDDMPVLGSQLLAPVVEPIDKDAYYRKLPLDPKQFFRTRTRSVTTYNSLLRVHALKGTLDSAMDVKKQMLREGWVPNTQTYGALMRACTHAKDVETCFALFQEMKQRGVPRSLPTFSHVVATCCAADDFKRALAVMKEMIKDSLQPNAVIFTILIHQLYRAGYAAKAEAMFTEMVALGHVPDAHSYTTAIRIAASQDAAEQALALFGDMQLVHKQEPTLPVFNAVILACSKRLDYYERAFELYDQAVAKGLVPNAYTFNALLAGSTRQGDIAGAQLILKQMDEFRVDKDKHTYRLVISTIANSQTLPSYILDGTSLTRADRTKLALETMEAAVEAQLFDVNTANAVLECYTRPGLVEGAVAFFKTAYDKLGVKHNHRTFNHIIRMAKQTKKLELGLEALLLLKEANYKPTVQEYRLLLKLCHRVNSEEAVKVSRKLLKEVEERDLLHEIPKIDQKRARGEIIIEADFPEEFRRHSGTPNKIKY